MQTGPERAVQRALAVVDAPFQLNGNSPIGLDCVGLIMHAYDLAAPPSMPAARTLGSAAAAPWCACLEQCGFAQLDDNIPDAPGDVWLVDCGRSRLHLALWTRRGFVHAHAGLRRVTLAASMAQFAVISRWRLVASHLIINP